MIWYNGMFENYRYNYIHAIFVFFLSTLKTDATTLNPAPRSPSVSSQMNGSCSSVWCHFIVHQSDHYTVYFVFNCASSNSCELLYLKQPIKHAYVIIDETVVKLYIYSFSLNVFMFSTFHLNNIHAIPSNNIYKYNNKATTRK